MSQSPRIGSTVPTHELKPTPTLAGDSRNPLESGQPFLHMGHPGMARYTDLRRNPLESGQPFLLSVRIREMKKKISYVAIPSNRVNRSYLAMKIVSQKV